MARTTNLVKFLPSSARASNELADLYIRQLEDRDQTTPGGRPHWHIDILDAKSGRARGEDPSQEAAKNCDPVSMSD